MTWTSGSAADNSIAFTERLAAAGSAPRSGTSATRAADKLAINVQIRDHLIKIYVFNSQNVTPDVQAQLAQVKAEHIPRATITETLVPASATYQAWQARQLRDIEKALAQAAQSPS